MTRPGRTSPPLRDRSWSRPSRGGTTPVTPPAARSITSSGPGRPQRVAELDPEDYYDFQVNRPTVRSSTARPAASPGPAPASLSPGCPAADRDVVLVRGVEPNMRWRGFCDEMLAIAAAARAPSRSSRSARCSPTARTPGPSRSAARLGPAARPSSISSAAATRGPPGSSACFQDTSLTRAAGGVVLGGGAALRPHRRAQRRPWRCCGASRTCSTCRCPSGSCRTWPARGSGRWTNWPPTTTTSREYVASLEEREPAMICPKPPARRSPRSSSATCAAATGTRPRRRSGRG